MRRTQFEGKEPRGREMDTGEKSQHHCNIFIGSKILAVWFLFGQLRTHGLIFGEKCPFRGILITAWLKILSILARLPLNELIDDLQGVPKKVHNRIF